MYYTGNAGIRQKSGGHQSSERLGMEPRRMTAEEKDALLKEYHPDYREDGFDTIKIGPNKGEKVPKELGASAALQQPSAPARRSI